MALMVVVPMAIAGCLTQRNMADSSRVEFDLDSAPMIVVYPETVNTDLQTALDSVSSKCAPEKCGGDVTVISEAGTEAHLRVSGMVDPKVSFSPSFNQAVLTDLFNVMVLKEGKLERYSIETNTPIFKYASIADQGDIKLFGHLPADEQNDFSMLDIGIKGGEYSEKTIQADGEILGCNDSLYMLSGGEASSSDKVLNYPDYIYNSSQRDFQELHSGTSVARHILSYSCNPDHGFEYIAQTEGVIRRGIYDRDTGFTDSPIDFDWNNHTTTNYIRKGDFQTDFVTSLNTLGEMRKFDNQTKRSTIVWDVNDYFPSMTESDIYAHAILKEDSVIFFGPSKKDQDRWIMVEVDKESGKPLRSIYVSFLDKKYQWEDVALINVGNVEKFREWADKQPKYEL